MNQLTGRMRFCVAFILCLMTSAAAQVTFTNLLYFSTLQGSGPYSSLIQGTDGNLYGIAYAGGLNNQGTVFKITPAGVLTVVYNFCAQPNCSDGASPEGSLVLDTDGNLVGSAAFGGTANSGVVFKVTPAGTYTVLHSFTGSDGAIPFGLSLGQDRNFYGATANSSGTIFKLTPSGTLTTLYSFCSQANCTDGRSPSVPIQGADGNLYGTTQSGGNTSSACQVNYDGCGTVYKVTRGGKLTVLHAFNFADGKVPLAPLIQSASGSFYGTTFEGGYVYQFLCGFGCGTIFKISSTGAFATVRVLHGVEAGNPESALAYGSDGNFYGEVPTGGGDGAVFKQPTSGKFSIVYDFRSDYGGGGSTAIFQATDGKFYGTAGPPLSGLAFSLETGLRPFVAFVLPTGKVDQSAQILGQGFTGTTSVTFNGVPTSNFTVVSDTYLTAVVPKGATTGNVVVTTTAGTLTSNVSFRVTK